MTLSERTQAIISERAASEYTHGALTNLLKHANLGKNDPGPTKADGKSWINRDTRVSSALGKKPDTDKLLALAARILNQKAAGTTEPEWLEDLRASLFEDGYAPQFSENTWTIQPLGAEEVPLAQQVTGLEKALIGAGFPVAAQHYRQAFGAFKRQDWEAANGATRTAVEGFLLEISKAKLGYDGTSGGTAIRLLNEGGFFEQGEHDYVKGFWALSHRNGSHPGLSSQEEALFRFSAATSALTFFIHRWTRPV